MSTCDQARSRQIADALLRRGGATVEGVADQIAAAWARVDDALVPIVGRTGVAAMYQRSVHLQAGRHPVLVAEGEPGATGPALLRAVLLRQPQAEAAAALGGDLLQTFRELLSGMVGASLTERLLRPVWAELSSGASAEGDLP